MNVKIKDITISKNLDLVLIAGPCVIEDHDMCVELALELKEITKEAGFSFIFKASFDKANRTSLKSFRGPGLNKGLLILEEVKEKANVAVLTDIHCRQHIEPVAKVVDVIQIPAFLSRQTDLIIEAASSGKPLNIKRGQFLAPWDIKYLIEKATSTGNENLLITERGINFGYNNLISDMRALPIMRKFGYPVIFDATHSVQQPGGLGQTSAGEREFVPVLARSAIAAGCDGLFLEVHPNPDKALSDGPNMVTPKALKEILIQTKAIKDALK